MPVNLKDRPTDAVREEVIDQLILNYSHGRLSEAAFERRLDQAMDSQENEEIAALAEDLELITDPKYADLKKSDFGVKYTSNPAADGDYLVSIFGGSSRSGRWSVAKEISSLSIFGGADIDFTDAEFFHKDVSIKVLCIFGGDDIYIPPNVNVVSKVFCIFGGVNNKAPSIADRNAPTITLEGLVIFGGVDIKIKTTIKEKFVTFADNLKRMLE